MLKIKVFLSLTVTFYLLFFANCNIEIKTDTKSLNISNKIENSSVFSQENEISKKHNILGCYGGMGGGKLEIKAETFSDLVSKETSIYKLISPSDLPKSGIETGEKYLLETDGKLKKSFLSKFILLSYLEDETVGITGYENFEDIGKEKIKGMGLFGKIDCKILKK